MARIETGAAAPTRRVRAARLALMIGVLGVVAPLSTSAAAATTPAFAPVPGSPFDTGPNSGPQAAAFSPMDGLLATADYDSNTVSMFFVDPATGTLAPVPPPRQNTGGNPYAVAFSPSGDLLATANAGTNDVSVFQVDSETGTLRPVADSPFPTGAAGPVSVAFSPSSGGLLAVADADADAVSMFSVDPASGHLTLAPNSPFHTDDDPVSVAFSRSGDLLASANQGDNTVSLFSVDPASGNLTPVAGPTTPTGAAPASVAFSPSAGLLATADSGDNTVSMFAVDEATGALTSVSRQATPTGHDPVSVAFSPSGDLLATADQGDGTASVFSVNSASGALTPVAGSAFATGASPLSVAFGGSGGLLATANGGVYDTVSVLSVGPPSATIDAPADGASFAQGEQVATSFRCDDAVAAPGIASCRDGNGADAPAGRLDTSTPGSHTYEVTATSRDGQHTTQTIAYSVHAAAPGGTPGGAVPVISGLSPDSGPTGGGQRVSIGATNLTEASEVLFDGVPASDVVVDRYDHVTVTTPAHAAGPVDVTVRTAAATSAAVTYTYLDSHTPATTAPDPDVASSSSPTARRCVVPHLRGRTVAAARVRLRAAGCALGAVRRTRARHGARTARVIRQAPAAGSDRAAGARVAITTRVRAR